MKHHRGKRRTEISSENQFAYVGEVEQRKNYRKTAGSQTVRLLSAHEINVNNPKEGKTVRATINGVIENDADPNYVRRNIVTKGAVVIQTSDGYASPVGQACTESSLACS